MQRALVTGGAGFIGSHLCERLISEGWRVTAVDNFDPFYDRRQKQENITSLLATPGFTLAEADIRDASALDRIAGDYDVIVHLAAKAGVRPSIQAPLAYQETNVAGTQTMLEFARRRGVKQFVFTSSSSVYGVNPRVPWQESDSGLMPISPYASTKVSGELLGHVYSHLYGMRFVALRLFTVFGPRQRPDLAIRKFAELMLRGEPISLFGDGETRRDYTYVADIVEGFRAAMSYTASTFEIFNLSNERTVTLAQLVRSLESALAVKASIAWMPEQPGDVPQTWGDISKARALLGYSPKTVFDAGIVEFVRWWRQRTSRIAVAAVQAT
ncbi:MAG TPA: NAD-dependent epimerase/dehydratase family protein [Bryobacteraceae bacterium]|nr:NAD-dependent epimerase/dehydratase family protein [Bryobacteraceae bacterium]